MPFSNRRFGMEFEFSLPWEDLDKIAKKSISRYYGSGSWISRDDKYSVSHGSDLKKWHIKRENSDVSELNTPVSKLTNLNKILKVMGSIAKKHPKIQISECGYHIRFDVKDIDKYNIVGLWLHCERAIIECFPLERRKVLSVEKLIRQKEDGKKYVAALLENNVNQASHGDIISLRDYDEYKTVEIRIAEGTTDTNLIKYWTKFLLYWLEYAKSLHPATVPCRMCNGIKMDLLLNLISADEETKDFMMWRHKKYHKLPYWVS